LGASLTVRGGDENPYITDNGNLILDMTIEGGIKDPAAFRDALKKTTGVVEHGLFIGLTDTLIVGGPDGPKVVGRLSGGAA
jgi:ribose 5-phosphate isomerase A